MRHFLCLPILFLGLYLFSTPVEARRKSPAPPPTAAPPATPAPEPSSLPSETAPKVSLDAPPSASLQPFVDTHLDKLLAPLGEPAFTQAEIIASLQSSYADGMAAAPDARKPSF